MYKTVNKNRDNILPVFGPYSKFLVTGIYIYTPREKAYLSCQEQPTVK